MSQRKRVTALLLDLDGVLRRWDPAVTAGVEREYSLATGSLHGAAMAPERLNPAVTGQVSHADWMAGVAEALAGQAGGVAAARAAVGAWQAYRGEVDPDVLALVREVRAAGVRVGLGTNATDLLDADLAALGLAGEVDLVVNSSVVGSAKPSREYFHAAATALATVPDQVLLVDDDDRAVRGARAAGLSALRWSGPADLPYVRAALAA
ncbi:HAD-IA family hydrolase [Polymorphospora sp. NPDC050346]|uniref:HAD-IA family hydrolase n=1 Tax=Polymorphospora sp. NPDC050346 TaxID=3155780 RepID=UPI0033CFD6D8